MTPERLAEVVIEFDQVNREAWRQVEQYRGRDLSLHIDALTQVAVLRQVAKVLHIELAVAR
jgi:hypothetical protein